MTHDCLICSILEEMGFTSEIFLWTLGPGCGALALGFQVSKIL